LHEIKEYRKDAFIHLLRYLLNAYIFTKPVFSLKIMHCRVSFSAVVSTIVLLELAIQSEGFHVITSSLTSRQNHHYSNPTSLAVTSQDVEDNFSEVKQEERTEKHVPYAVARGDGSTGGGGRAMPKAAEEEDGLVRPKVGAEMPVGRPNWFRVPGPSQGMFSTILVFCLQ